MTKQEWDAQVNQAIGHFPIIFDKYAEKAGGDRPLSIDHPPPLAPYTVIQRVNKNTHRIVFKDEDEHSVTIVVEPK